MSVELVHGQHPGGVVGRSSDTVEALLLSVAAGDRDAFAALQSRMAGLVRVNVRRVLRDVSRSEAVTQEVFAAVFKDAIHFDPHRDSAEAWLLTRTHQRAMDELRSQAMDQPHPADATPIPRADRIDRSVPALLA